MNLQGIHLPTVEEIDELVRLGKIGYSDMTPEEMGQVKDKRKSRFDVGAKSEERAKGWLERFFNADVRKAPLREVNTFRGPVWISQDVDYIMTEDVSGLKRITKIEVKGTITDSFPITRISERERAFLNRSEKQGYQTWLLLMWWNKTDKRPDCDLMHLITWAQWKQIEIDQLAKSSGNYKGGSIRRKIDLKDWTRYEIRKDGSRWKLSADHWLRGVAGPVSQDER